MLTYAADAEVLSKAEAGFGELLSEQAGFALLKGAASAGLPACMSSLSCISEACMTCRACNTARDRERVRAREREHTQERAREGVRKRDQEALHPLSPHPQSPSWSESPYPLFPPITSPT